MNPMMIITTAAALSCSLAFAQAQASQDPTLAANAGNAAVQQELGDPDGVAIKGMPDGTYQIFARGTGVYDFNETEEILSARKVAEMRAKANLTKYLKEKVTVEDGLANVSKKMKHLTGDGKNVSKESITVISEMIRSQSSAILTGVVTLKEQRIPHGNGGEIQVTIGTSPKTLLAAQKIARGIDASLINREARVEPVTQPPSVMPTANKPSARYNNTDF